MPTKDKRHQQVMKKISLIMKDVSDDLMEKKTMPVLNVPKVGYDNTVWSDEKRMLTIGEKKVGISQDR